MGCGSHIPSVLDAVPESQWCSCGPQVERSGKMYPPGGKCLSTLFERRGICCERRTVADSGLFLIGSFGGMIMNMLGFGGKKGDGKEEL
jgi:hypothetical protein